MALCPPRDPSAGRSHQGVTQARVDRVASSAALIALLKERVGLSDDYLEDHPPYFFRAEISNDRLDAYYTHMDPETTLRNFAADASDGVSFQNSHDWRSLGFGRSLNGEFKDAARNTGASVVADFYTVPGLRLNQVSTDDLIGGIQSGLIHDVSVGFHGGDILCDLCGLSLYSWDCWHYPGMEYDADEVEWLADDRTGVATGARRRKKKKTDTTYVLATATVIDAHLSEVSAVYDGATPGAAILKAQRAVEAGRIRPEVVSFIEQRYRVRLPDASRFYAAGLVPAPEPPAATAMASDRMEVEMAQSETGRDPTASPTPEIPVEIASLLREARTVSGLVAQEGATPPSDVSCLNHVVEEARRVPGLAARVEQLEARVAELTPLAEMGTRYRTALIDATLAEGVRALGGAFNVEMNRRLLEGQGVDVIDAQLRQYQAVAAARFPGGAVVQDGGTPPETDSPTHAMAAYAYRA